MEASSPPSTPTSFKSARSTTSANSSPGKTTANARVTSKMSYNPSSMTGPTKAAQATNAKLYAPAVGKGRGNGGAWGAMGDGEGANAAVIAGVREVELEYGAPAFIGEVPLIALLRARGAPTDTPKGPVIHPPRQQEMYGNTSPAGPAPPAPSAPSAPPAQQEELQPITMERLAAERTPSFPIGMMSEEEWQLELKRLRAIAFEYGRLLRRKEMFQEEETRRQKLASERQAIHDQIWEEYVEKGKNYIDILMGEDERAKENIYSPALQAAVNLQSPSPQQSSVPHSPVAGPSTEGQGKDKKRVKKFFGKIAKLGGKIGMDAAEEALKGALDEDDD